MPLRIAFDLDGVLADMEGELASHAGQLFGGNVAYSAGADEIDPASAEVPAAPALRRLRLTPRQTTKLWRHVETIDNFWTMLREIEPGAIARLGEIAAARRWEVIFLTRRPGSAGATAQVQSQRWLQAKGFPLPSVFVVQGSRGRIAAALDLDIVVDDTPENCLDVVADSRARAILVLRDGAQMDPAAVKRLGVGVVGSVGECLDVLAQIDSDEESGGLVDRVMRMLGLRQAGANRAEKRL